MASRLLWLDRTGKEIGTLGGLADYWGVSLSHDGRSVATTKHDYRTGQFRIWIASVEAGLFEPLSDVDHSYGPIWSRDGNSLYYTDLRSRQFFRRQILSTNAQADILVMELPRNKFVQMTDISPDRRFAAGEFVTDDAHSEVVWTALGLTASTPSSWHLVGASGPEGLLPSFSPDGKWLAYASRQTGNLELYVAAFPPSNSGKHRISQNGGHTPRWRRDGKELFFLAADSGLMSVDLSRPARQPYPAPTLLFHPVPRLATAAAVFDASPDGQRFLLVDGQNRTGESEIEMILNWPSLLHQ
jgi:Tol biopolymer transport system component